MSGELVMKKGCSTSQLALAWVTQQPDITSVIIGPRPMERLKENVGCLEVKITEKEFQDINQLSPSGSTLLRR